jgi:hypothetical protein
MHIDRKRTVGPVASKTAKSILRARQNASASPSSGSQSNNDGGGFNYVTTIVVSVAIQVLPQVANLSGCGGRDRHPRCGKYHLDVFATEASRRESSQASTQVPTQQVACMEASRKVHISARRSLEPERELVVQWRGDRRACCNRRCCCGCGSTYQCPIRDDPPSVFTNPARN